MQDFLVTKERLEADGLPSNRDILAKPFPSHPLISGGRRTELTHAIDSHSDAMHRAIARRKVTSAEVFISANGGAKRGPAIKEDINSRRCRTADFVNGKANYRGDSSAGRLVWATTNLQMEGGCPRVRTNTMARTIGMVRVERNVVRLYQRKGRVRMEVQNVEGFIAFLQKNIESQNA